MANKVVSKQGKGRTEAAPCARVHSPDTMVVELDVQSNTPVADEVQATTPVTEPTATGTRRNGLRRLISFARPGQRTPRGADKETEGVTVPKLDPSCKNLRTSLRGTHAPRAGFVPRLRASFVQARRSLRVSMCGGPRRGSDATERWSVESEEQSPAK